jgi:hypothetical protein
MANIFIYSNHFPEIGGTGNKLLEVFGLPSEHFHRTSLKTTGNVRTNVTLRCVRVINVAMEK